MALASSARVEQLLWPLDRLRTRTLRATMPASSYFAGRRGPRVALIGAVAVACALGGTVLFPLWMLALGPVLLGVPHLLGDLRYCVVRPGWHRRPALWVGLGLPIAAVMLGAPTAVGFAAIAGTCVALEGALWRRALAVVLAGLAAWACLVFEAAGTLALIHLHNVVAVILWSRWREDSGGPGGVRWRSMVLLAFAAGSVLIAAGAFDGAGLAWAPAPAQLGLEHHLGALAPGLSGGPARRLVLLFIFAQSVHYAVWLRLIPEDDRERSTPRSFRGSFRALEAELGPLVWAALLGAALVIGWAVFDLAGARAGYLQVARFHAFIELAVLASLWTRGRSFIVSSNPESRT